MLKKLNSSDTDKIEAIYKLFNKYSKEVGFVLKPSIVEAAKKSELVYLEKEDKIIGAIKFHKRKDNFITLYEIVVDEDYRGKGYGARMISYVSQLGLIKLKCPVDNKSNKFYEKIGFTLLRKELGKKRPLNIWAGLNLGVRYKSCDI